MSGSRSKKNGKKSKLLNISGLELLQVKSVKLNTTKAAQEAKSNAKSEGNLRRNSDKKELEASLLKQFNALSVSNESGTAPGTSATKTGGEEGCPDTEKICSGYEDGASLDMEYFPENCGEAGEKPEQFPYSYKYYPKSNKTIKFTNQVTVLYFNGDDILCESMEPLKKELDQQIRNKEMRKEHLISKGQVDNAYLF